MSNDREDAPPAGADAPTASRGADAGSRFSAFEGATEDFGIGPGGADPLIGADIGGVTIVRLIGQGGMGRVYEARQVKPSRPVAVKVIRPGVVSEAHMRRFDHEAEILARLRHPGIAQIHTVGTYHSPAGDVPFFVMEYIPDARTLVEFADHHRLSTHDRLDLFRKVCDAVAHGHTRGVVHRDLKPSNILVDATGQPKVIDFGVAKTTDVDLALTTMRTDVGQLIGTLQYMSPEQFDGQPDEVDVRSDVYALGVVLYELLAGQPPYDVRRKAVIEAARVVKEEDPAPLSSLNRTLRRDVGVIAGKCLAKEPGGRYSSAAELGADVGRYLAGEPIHASPPGFIDGVVRLARRHKAAAAAVGVVAASLVAAVVGISLFAEQAERQRQDATKSAELAQHKRNVSDLNRFHLLQERGDSTNAFALLDDIERRFTPENIPVEVRVTRSEADDAIAVFPGRAFAFSPDGSLIAVSGALENEAQPSRITSCEYAMLVDARTGAPVVRLEELSGGCVDGSPRFSRDGTRVAFATSDRELTQVLDFHVFSIDRRSLGSRAASWGSRGASVWDVRTGRLCDVYDDSLRPLLAALSDPPPRPAAISPDARRAAFVEGLGTPTCRLRIHAGDVVKRAVVERSDDTAARIEADNLNAEWDEEPVIDDSVSRAAIPDGNLIQLWDLDDVALIATLKAPRSPEPIFSPDGKRLLLCGQGSLEAKEPEERNKVTRLYGIPADARGWWSLFTLWDTTTGEQVAAFGIPGVAFDQMDHLAKQTLAFSPDSELLVITGNSDGESPEQGGAFVEVRSGRTGQLRYRLRLDKANAELAQITQCAFSQAGKDFVVCRADGSADLMELTDGEVFTQVPIESYRGEPAGNAACFSPDGKKVVFRLGKELRVFRKSTTPKGKPCFAPLARLRGQYEIGIPTFSPDGSRLAATLGERQVALWDAAQLETGPFTDCPFAKGKDGDAGFGYSVPRSGGRWCFDSPLLAFTGDLGPLGIGGYSSGGLAETPSIYTVCQHGIERSTATIKKELPPSESVPLGLSKGEHVPDGLVLDGATRKLVLVYGQQVSDFSRRERGLPEYSSGLTYLLPLKQLPPYPFGWNDLRWRSTLTKHRFGVRVISVDNASPEAWRGVNAVSPTGKYGLTWSPPELIDLSTGKTWAVPELSPEVGAERVECSWSEKDRFLAIAVNYDHDGELSVYACAIETAPQLIVRRRFAGGIALSEKGPSVSGRWPNYRFTFGAIGDRVLWRDGSGDRMIQRVFQSPAALARALESQDYQGPDLVISHFNADLTRGVQVDKDTFRVWDLEKGVLLGMFPHADANGFDFDDRAGCVFDNQRSAAVFYGTPPPLLWSANSPHTASPLNAVRTAIAAAFSPDGSRLAILGRTTRDEPTLFIFDAETAGPLGEWRLERHYDRVTFVNDGRHILTLGDHAKLWGLSHRDIHTARNRGDESSVALASEFDAWQRLDTGDLGRVIDDATRGLSKQEQRAVFNAFLRRSAERERDRQRELLVAKRSRLQPFVDKVCPPVDAANLEWWEALQAAAEHTDDIDAMINSQLSAIRGDVQEDDRAELARMIERRLEEWLQSRM